MGEDILLLTGLGDSAEGHWQSMWQEQDVSIQKVMHKEWDNPNVEVWVTALQNHGAVICLK